MRPGPADPPGEFGQDLLPGARNAIRTCLRVLPEEHVMILTDARTAEIAHSLADQIQEVGATHETHVMEEYGARPMLRLPIPVRDAFERADVTIYAAQPETGELSARREMTEIVDRRRIRHAHMVSISREIMLEGMLADFNLVDALSSRVRDRAEKATVVRATSRGGSEIEATFDPSIRWLKTSGVITGEKWANLPGGEVFTSPARVDGVYVVDGVLGDYLGGRYGDMQENPLTVWIENSRMADAQCSRSEILDDFLSYVRTAENSDRVGEFALGTNTAVRAIIGNILQDEKLPGLHLAFGHPYSEHTGAPWKCPTHLDIVGRHFDVWFDEDKIMEDGRFLI